MSREAERVLTLFNSTRNRKRFNVEKPDALTLMV